MIDGNILRLKVLKAGKTVCSDVTLCSLVEIYRFYLKYTACIFWGLETDHKVRNKKHALTFVLVVY